ncbi:unknown [Fusobacterium sp. CAG:439]|nr:unknown [Fusobacterium sp. CAG:439]
MSLITFNNFVEQIFADNPDCFSKSTKRMMKRVKNKLIAEDPKVVKYLSFSNDLKSCFSKEIIKSFIRFGRKPKFTRLSNIGL